MVPLVAKCPKCGLLRYGWALKTQPPKTCPNCGEVLEIKYGKDAISDSDTSFIVDKSSLKSDDSS